jgi:hypothetical protein
MALKLIQGKQITVNLTGSFTGSFSGSFNGTSSYATNALTASYLSGYVSPFPYTGSAQITGSLGITGSLSTTGSDASFNGVTVGKGKGSLPNNVVVGAFTLGNNTTGDYNTAIGYNAMGVNGAGFGNVAIGGSALSNITTGYSNVGIGFSATLAANSNSNAIVIGDTAVGLGSNTVVIGNDNVTLTALKGNVALGKTSANARLDISGSALITGSLNVSRGITGSLFGTASQAVSASWAPVATTVATASFVTSSNVYGPFGSNSILSSSFAISSSRAVTASFAQTAPYSGLQGTVPTWNQNTTGNAATATTASFAISSSRAVTASFALTSSNISPAITSNVNNYVLTATGTGTINGESTLTADGTTLITSLKFEQGNGSSAAGDYSHAQGKGTKAVGDYSHAEGNSAQAKGDYSHAEGNTTNAYGTYSHAEGQETETGITTAFRSTVSSGTFHIDSGYGDITSIFTIGNTLISDDSDYDALYGKQLYIISDVFWDGMFTVVVITDGSVNTSYSNIGDINYIFQWKDYNGNKTISGGASHTEGYRTQAAGQSSHAEGNRTIALGDYQHVQGQFNIPLTTPSSFVHGNGTDNENRSNLIYAHDSTVEITGSLIVTDTITGNLTGTATNATSASYSLSSSFAISSSRAISSSFATTSSFTVSSSFAISSSVAVSSSFAISSSRAISSSFATTASFVNTLNQNVIISGSLKLDPTQDPDPTGTDLDSTVLFQSSSSTALGYDLYFRQNGNLVKWKWIEGILETGLLYGGAVTYSGSNVYISPGSGIIAEHNATTSSELSPMIEYVTWNAITQSITNIATQQVTYLYIDNNGSLQQQSTRFTSQQYHSSIPLGAVGHFDYTQVSAFGGAVQTAYDQGSQTSNFIDAFGPLKMSGYGLTGQAGSLRLSVGSGTSFIHGGFYQNNPEFPSQITTPSQATASLARVQRSGSAIEFDTNAGNLYTVVDPTKYDRDGDGTLADVGSGNWSIQRVFSDPKTGVLYIYYGQARYTSLLNALQFLPTDPFTEGDTFDFTTFVGFLVLKGNASDITNTASNSVINGGLFRGSGQGSGGGIALSNLEDLTDVSITSPTNGQALVYDAGIWQNGTPLNATSASFALTASYATQALSASWAPGGPAFPFTGSAIITGSLTVTGSARITNGLTVTGSLTAINGFIKPGAGSEYLLADGTTTAGGSGGTSLGLVQAFSLGLQNIF